MFDVNFISVNRDVYIELHNRNMIDVYNMEQKAIFLLDIV